MTNQDKIQIWEALYKCTRNGYPGATYEQYDTPKDPRVRGGRWNWTYHQLRDIYEQLVKWGEANEPTAAWRELEKYKNKIPPACLTSIYQSITFLPAGLVLVYNDITNAPVVDPADVAQWNSLFDLPSSGNPFTSVLISGTQTIVLIGGSNINCDVVNFSSDTNIISINDTAGCITGQCIKSTDCTSLISVNYPNAVLFSKLDHAGCNQLVTVNAPLVENIGSACFKNCLVLKTFYVPSCIDLGGSIGNDQVFSLITGQSITVTINSIIATCNVGGPDGDIIALLTANPSSTIIYV
jgi:hypothetical protein